MTAPAIPDADGLAQSLTGLGGLGAVVVEAQGFGWSSSDAGSAGQVRIGVHRRGALPNEGLETFDILLSADPAAPAPWVGCESDELDAALERILKVIADQPVAATVLAQTLRMTLSVSFDQALVLESLAYSMLLACEGFQRWRRARPVRHRPDEPAGRVAVQRDESGLHLRLIRSGAHNAFDAAMRDQLVEALEFARDDPDRGAVRLDAEGASFSAGGDLNEFGTAPDVGLAHAIRVLQSPARLMQELGERLTVHLHGACIGAGIEAPAAAHHVIADRQTWFRLPELSMGLIPGAGGTATISRRIGRQRTGYLAMSGIDLDAETALHWGLVDGLHEV